MKTIKPTNRRNFLLAAGLGGAGVAAAAVATRRVQSREKLVEAAKQPSGYRSTEHIEKYYKTTKV
jgi:hypothetical protein